MHGKRTIWVSCFKQNGDEAKWWRSLAHLFLNSGGFKSYWAEKSSESYSANFLKKH